MLHARTDYNRIQDPEERIGDDEPVFLFRAKDVLAPVVLARYAELLKQHGCQQEMIDSTLLWEQKMREWQRQRGCKLPDLPVEYETQLAITQVGVVKLEPKADFSGWVGHRAKLANGEVVLITGGRGIRLFGSVADTIDKSSLVWSSITGASTEKPEWDLVELLSGPSRNRKGE